MPCAVSEFEENERTSSVVEEACLAARPSRADGSQDSAHGHTSEQASLAPDDRRNEDEGQARQSDSQDGDALPNAGVVEADDETTRRLAQQIEEWGREETGPDIVAIAKAYVGIEKMAQEVRHPRLYVICWE